MDSFLSRLASHPRLQPSIDRPVTLSGLLFSMGLLGYIFSRSTISLVLGITPGLATLLLGTLSLKFWRSGRSSFLLILAQAGRMNFKQLVIWDLEVFLCLLVDLFGFQMVCWS
ncbi:hypothetical protein ZEAMMB73_Zm00001d007163 [Zea mays]|uniref:Protein FATTY ACID EXPORT 1 chloroplastic n=1 Tax=Zea mays TaxID=4577 RepID=A0A1D6F4E0_MAIZE|nr:hypothetical protein ZEAMMB73_Zm00001d007163 [Zea mays]